MDHAVLLDKSIRPDNELVFSIIGDKRVYWETIMDYAREHHEHISEEWKFYNDGHRWLFRLLQKKKTILWIGVEMGSFRVTFWFGDKAAPLIEASKLPKKMIDEFKNAKRYNLIRGVTIDMKRPSDVKHVQTLIDIKVLLK